MNSMYEDVRQFHHQILGVPDEKQPTLVNQEFLVARYKFLIEETREFFDAAMLGEMTKAVDGLLDTIYVALGTLHMMGVDADKVWPFVQVANMAKQRGVTHRGIPVDATKPPGWVGPESAISAWLLEQISR